MAHTFELESKRIRALVEKARYREAFRSAKILYQAHRGHPEAQYLYAVMLGDNNEGLNSRQSERNRKTAVGLLKPLLRKLHSFDSATRYRVRNEYYWFSQQYRKQYLLGSEGLRRGMRRASYSQGVGAAWHALKLAQERRPELARRWAGKSVRAWQKFLRTEKYYNAHVHLGLALGVMGQQEEMERSLKRGAREAGKPASDHEFNAIRSLVKQLPGEG